jgi:hypothetical protein
MSGVPCPVPVWSLEYTDAFGENTTGEVYAGLGPRFARETLKIETTTTSRGKYSQFTPQNAIWTGDGPIEYIRIWTDISAKSKMSQNSSWHKARLRTHNKSCPNTE